jgi:hypothetical protein
VTPEGESYPDLPDEAALRSALGEVLQRDRTKEILLFMLNLVR